VAALASRELRYRTLPKRSRVPKPSATLPPARRDTPVSAGTNPRANLFVSRMLIDQTSAVKRRDELVGLIADGRFPCVGAKSALARGQLKILVGHSLASAWDDLRIHTELLDWVREYRSDSSGLRSLAVTFEGPENLSEARFEQLMWERLQSLADKDDWLGQPCDASVSPDPADPEFGLSIGGAAFFVVGLHPDASRPSRRAPRPTMAFNLHNQFEQLRHDGVYDRMREKIIERDVALSGSPNPMLARFGESSGARQYSGRAVGSDWRCPFHDPRNS
jgi:FPC/CPF motif-containing protein YcgG